MAMKTIEGDTRVYTVINTTEYNADTQWSVKTAGINELPDLGFDDDEVARIDRLTVGEITKEFDFQGVIVIRVA